MFQQGQYLLWQASRRLQLHPHWNTISRRHIISGASSNPRLSIWRRKKEMKKEGLMVTKELKRLQSYPERFEQFMKSQVSPLLKSDLVTVLVEFQRQKLISLSMKIYDMVRKETWCRPDMFFYLDMLVMLDRNKKSRY
ncbi:hypothetical protein ACJIZ3_006933 [Penstemon smallii]|uniref:Uncharacterized protein n=1 Tax=Penstemon smallii TaxID=265156 RepID=A0ABD3S9C4_9LAMI